VRNFAASPLGAPTVIQTEFTNGEPFLLTWQGNAAGYNIYSGADPYPVYGGTDTTFAVPDGLHQDATFVLVATAAPGGSPPSLVTALTVGVSDPDLNPPAVTASGTVTAPGLATALVTAADVSVTGDGQAGTLDVTGTPSFNGGATVTGALNATQLSTLGLYADNGVVTVGQASLQDVEIFDVASLTDFTATAGTIRMLGTPMTLELGSYTPPYIDGFLLGRITSADGVSAGTLVATATYPGGWWVAASATAGPTAAYLDQSFTLLVQNGQSVDIELQTDQGAPQVEITFFPLGDPSDSSASAGRGDER
jgi:hypothetical protein